MRSLLAGVVLFLLLAWMSDGGCSKTRIVVTHASGAPADTIKWERLP